MENDLIFWIFKKHGKSRGYILTEAEWKKFIPYSEKRMEKKFKQWQKELKQVAENKGHQTS